MSLFLQFHKHVWTILGKIENFAGYLKRHPQKLTTIIFVVIVLFLVIFEKPLIDSVLLTTEAIPDFPLHPLNIFGYKTFKEEVHYYSSGKQIRAYIYRPKSNGKFPVMILSVGATKYGIDDPLLERFASALAKIGIIAFAPEVPLLKEEVILKESISDYVNAFNFIYNQPYVKKDKVGFAGFCVGGSFSFIAGADRTIADKVSYLVLVSPYYDNLKTAASIVTKTDERDGKVYSWQPDKTSEDQVKRGFIAYLKNADERSLLNDLINSDKKITDDLQGLSDDGKLIFSALKADNREKFYETYNKFTEEGKLNFELLSPKNVVGNLNKNTKVFILVNKHDAFVPESETMDFKKNVPLAGFGELDSYAHVRPGVGLPRFVAFLQFTKLFVFINKVLRAVL